MSDCGDVKKVFVASTPSGATAIATATPIKGIALTDSAVDKIKLFLKNEEKSHDEFGLLIKVKRDGCSGYSYDMSLSPLADSEANGDKIFERDGARMMIEKASYFFVTGSTLDYIEALTGSGFTLGNPNVKSACACGSSIAF